MRTMHAGQQILVRADDPLAKIDIPHACAEVGFQCKIAPDDIAEAFSFRVIAPE